MLASSCQRGLFKLYGCRVTRQYNWIWSMESVVGTPNKGLAQQNPNGPRLVHERMLSILEAQPGTNGQLSCLHSFEIF